jgi:WD40 repeat protein
MRDNTGKIIQWSKHHLRRLVLLGALAGLLPLVHISASDDYRDVLVYTVDDFDGELTFNLFDPRRGESTPVYTSGRTSFSFSVDGRLAISCGPETEATICVIDTQRPDSAPITISTDPPASGFPIAWSPDGRYLAFALSSEDRKYPLYVWDGETVLNITPDDPESNTGPGSITWSRDGRLAFTAWSDRSDSRTGIYLWDGYTTTRLRQNPTGGDFAPTWSLDGRLAFMSEQDGDYDIIIWDGVSLHDSTAAEAFVNIATDLVAYYSFPVWTTTGLLSFEATGPQDSHAQIYVWDGQTATNISQNPTLHNGCQTWSEDGRWAFATFFSPLQLIYVRDANNRPLLTVEGQYTPAWSPEGYLAFCTFHWPDWSLSVWDGRHVTEIAQGREIRAQWPNGAGVACSSG